MDEEMVDKIIEEANITDQQQKMIAQNMLTQLANKEQLKENLSMMTKDNCPEQAIGIGDSWPQTTEINVPFPMMLNGKHTVTKKEGNIIHIAYQGTISNPQGNENLENMKIQGEQNAVLQVDVPTGLIHLSELEQQVKITSEAEPEDNPHRDILVRSQIKTSANSNIVKTWSDNEDQLTKNYLETAK